MAGSKLSRTSARKGTFVFQQPYEDENHGERLHAFCPAWFRCAVILRDCRRFAVGHGGMGEPEASAKQISKQGSGSHTTWSTYLGSGDGSHFSDLKYIDRSNVDKLELLGQR